MRWMTKLDNLDLRAVTDILGTLEIFRILKDVWMIQNFNISNLDLNFMR
jgi:hypothetical protein